MHTRPWWLIAVLFVFVVTPAQGLAQTSRAAGVVRDEAGRPIKGAVVTAENPQASPTSFTATTDDRGRWSVIGLRPGEWIFTATAPGHVPSQGRARIRTVLNNPPVDFVLAKGVAEPAPGALARVNTKELQRDLKTADALFDDGQYERAIAAYQAIIQEAPALTIINLQVGNAYRQMKRYERALAAYQEVLKTDPTNEKAQIALGMTNLEKGDLDAAEAVLTAAADTPGASGEIFLSLGEVKSAKNRPDEAASYYQQAHQADPNWGKPILKLAMVALNQGDRQTAAKHLKEVVAVDPNSADAAEARVLLEQLRQ